MYFRDLRGVIGVEDNKDKPNFILTLEDTANQLRGKDNHTSDSQQN
jgi:hypothetical protein